MSEHGGARAGAGRPKGSKSANAELRDLAREHSKTAIDALVAVVNDKSHSDRLKAADMLLSRGYGKPTEENPATDIFNRFMAEEISAIQASLELEANGLTVPAVLSKFLDNEINVMTYKTCSIMPELDKGPPDLLPRQ